MKCPSCEFENPEESKFCLECGEKLELTCPQCNKGLPSGAKFCNECGKGLDETYQGDDIAPRIEGERKHVTVLFSDLTGYTAMSEKLDPEEVKDITSRIFGEVSKIVDKYDGFIEKYAGDAVMVLFGVPKAHEDNAIRAIKVAREIHELVESISPEVENRIGQTISMHTGVNTGLVVTGEVDMERGTHDVAGDTINLASRLSDLAKPGEILVGRDTHRQSEGYFVFEALEPAQVRGKTESVQVYKVLSPKDRPITIHRLSGLRADLIGRKAEIGQLNEAVESIRQGRGRIFSICGDAGTGKSRLVEEFKASLDLNEVQWLEGRAYPYAQNVPYFPLIDLLNRLFEIEEGDEPTKIKEKVESGVEDLLGETDDIASYVGSLYALSYPEIEEVSPEFWRSKLQDAVQAILSAQARRSPTVFCLEDLHWADPSFVEFLRNALQQIRQPAIVLCVYRPTFNLFTSHQLSTIERVYEEIRVQELSTSEAQNMLESLLKTEEIPSELRRFVQEKAEGNPFYLEELVNSLIESEVLIQENGQWKITRPISDSEISSTIQGVISGRLDRLENETKRILQEASVIGRAFFYEILRRATELKEEIDRCLRGLEHLDLIRTRSLQPDLEYVFKHALTQEVVYNGLLKKERREIHERIAHVIEQLFRDRLPEFYETLAFHFKRGHSMDKAVDYLMRAGEKSLKRYAVEESHQYYGEAFNILTNIPEKSKENEGLLIDLAMKWALVFYYRADFKGLTKLLSAHEDLAKSLDDNATLGMFYAWYGFTLCCRGKFRDSYQYITKALQIGEEIESQRIIGYACTWLTWTCVELGLLEEAIVFGERAQKIFRILESDPYLYFKSLAGLGFAYWFRGERKKTLEAGKALVDFGHKHSNIRSLSLGHFNIGVSYYMDGDFPSALECCRKSTQISADPMYSMVAKVGIGMSYLLDGQFQEAETTLQEAAVFCREFGFEMNGAFAEMGLGVIQITKGHISEGFKTLEECKRACLENERRYFYAMLEYTLGKLYSQIAMREGGIKPSIMLKNMGFLMRNVPFARKKAETHFHKAIELAKEIRAKGVVAQAYLDLGLLHEAKGKTDKAKECISEALGLFEECGSDVYLKQAREALKNLQ